MRRHDQPHQPSFEPAEADIQQRAYFLWREAGCPAGRDLDLWLTAKEMLRHVPPPAAGAAHRGSSISAGRGRLRR
jgi:hypothetical protein